MSAYFLDTSALMKRYVIEVGSQVVLRIMDPLNVNQILISAITEVEMASAVGRRVRGHFLREAQAQTILRAFRDDLALEYNVTEVTPALIAAAVFLAESQGLRALDSIQLAAALDGNAERVRLGLPTLTFVCSDAELNAAAVHCGLPVIDPMALP